MSCSRSVSPGGGDESAAPSPHSHAEEEEDEQAEQEQEETVEQEEADSQEGEAEAEGEGEGEGEEDEQDDEDEEADGEEEHHSGEEEGGASEGEGAGDEDDEDAAGEGEDEDETGQSDHQAEEQEEQDAEQEEDEDEEQQADGDEDEDEEGEEEEDEDAEGVGESGDEQAAAGEVEQEEEEQDEDADEDEEEDEEEGDAEEEGEHEHEEQASLTDSHAQEGVAAAQSEEEEQQEQEEEEDAEENEDDDDEEADAQASAEGNAQQTSNEDEFDPQDEAAVSVGVAAAPPAVATFAPPPPPQPASSQQPFVIHAHANNITHIKKSNTSPSSQPAIESRSDNTEEAEANLDSGESDVAAASIVDDKASKRMSMRNALMAHCKAEVAAAETADTQPPVEPEAATDSRPAQTAVSPSSPPPSQMPLVAPVAAAPPASFMRFKRVYADLEEQLPSEDQQHPTSTVAVAPSAATHIRPSDEAAAVTTPAHAVADVTASAQLPTQITSPSAQADSSLPVAGIRPPSPAASHTSQRTVLTQASTVLSTKSKKSALTPIRSHKTPASYEQIGTTHLAQNPDVQIGRLHRFYDSHLKELFGKYAKQDTAHRLMRIEEFIVFAVDYHLCTDPRNKTTASVAPYNLQSISNLYHAQCSIKYEMLFPEFLTALIRIAQVVYQNNNTPIKVQQASLALQLQSFYTLYLQFPIYNPLDDKEGLGKLVADRVNPLPMPPADTLPTPAKATDGTGTPLKAAAVLSPLKKVGKTPLAKSSAAQNLLSPAPASHTTSTSPTPSSRPTVIHHHHHHAAVPGNDVQRIDYEKSIEAQFVSDGHPAGKNVIIHHHHHYNKSALKSISPGPKVVVHTEELEQVMGAEKLLKTPSPTKTRSKSPSAATITRLKDYEPAPILVRDASQPNLSPAADLSKTSPSPHLKKSTSVPALVTASTASRSALKKALAEKYTVSGKKEREGTKLPGIHEKQGAPVARSDMYASQPTYAQLMMNPHVYTPPFFPTTQHAMQYYAQQQQFYQQYVSPYHQQPMVKPNQPNTGMVHVFQPMPPTPFDAQFLNHQDGLAGTAPPDQPPVQPFFPPYPYFPYHVPPSAPTHDQFPMSPPQVMSPPYMSPSPAASAYTSTPPVLAAKTQQIVSQQVQAAQQEAPNAEVHVEQAGKKVSKKTKSGKDKPKAKSVIAASLADWEAEVDAELAERRASEEAAKEAKLREWEAKKQRQAEAVLLKKRKEELKKIAAEKQAKLEYEQAAAQPKRLQITHVQPTAHTGHIESELEEQLAQPVQNPPPVITTHTVRTGKTLVSKTKAAPPPKAAVPSLKKQDGGSADGSIQQGSESAAKKLSLPSSKVSRTKSPSPSVGKDDAASSGAPKPMSSAPPAALSKLKLKAPARTTKAASPATVSADAADQPASLTRPSAHGSGRASPAAATSAASSQNNSARQRKQNEAKAKTLNRLKNIKKPDAVKQTEPEATQAAAEQEPESSFPAHEVLSLTEVPSSVTVPASDTAEPPISHAYDEQSHEAVTDPSVHAAAAGMEEDGIPQEAEAVAGVPTDHVVADEPQPHSDSYQSQPDEETAHVESEAVLDENEGVAVSEQPSEEADIDPYPSQPDEDTTQPDLGSEPVEDESEETLPADAEVPPSEAVSAHLEDEYELVDAQAHAAVDATSSYEQEAEEVAGQEEAGVESADADADADAVPTEASRAASPQLSHEDDAQQLADAGEDDATQPSFTDGDASHPADLHASLAAFAQADGDVDADASVEQEAVAEEETEAVAQSAEDLPSEDAHEEQASEDVAVADGAGVVESGDAEDVGEQASAEESELVAAAEQPADDDAQAEAEHEGGGEEQE